MTLADELVKKVIKALERAASILESDKTLYVGNTLNEAMKTLMVINNVLSELRLIEEEASGETNK